ncbi:MAG: glycine zipper 2TM domain-containing protein [Pseudomonadota bacterium]
METTRTAPRLHPLMAAAATSVVIVSIAGTAALTGLLPSTRAASANVISATTPVAVLAAPVNTLPPLKLVEQEAPAIVEPAPVVKKAVQAKAPRAKQQTQRTRVARNDRRSDYRERNYAQSNYQEPSYRQAAPQPVAAKPNYLGIGAGAVIGGLLGNQVGGGNGKKLATVAGIIGGGMIGNEIQNRSKENAAQQERR